jgi:excisionase family DNA binding protein
MKPLITIQEAAQRSGISTKTIYRMMARGELSRIKFGRATRVCWDELIEYMQHHGLRRSLA